MFAVRSAIRVLPRHLSRRALALHSTPSRPIPVVASSVPSARRWGGSLPDRSSKFTKLTKEHIEAIRALLSSPSSLMSTLDGSASTGDLAGFNNDWMGKYFGKSPVVVKPKTTEEVGKVMKYCYDNDIAIVPQGGNTGLVGTST